jgi:hypothetical protein
MFTIIAFALGFFYDGSWRCWIERRSVFLRFRRRFVINHATGPNVV